jgi:hypothetical protein
MAGAGYKLFNTGDVLTAAQVNTYLNEQTVMVFASAAARTSALTSVLAEGMVSYLQDTNAVEVYNGSAWVGVSGTGDLTEIVAGTGITVTSGTGPIPTVALTTPVAATNGGTAQSTYTTGDLLYASATNTLTKRAIGSTGNVLTVAGGVPTWAAPAAGGGGLVFINRTTFSNVASQAIDNVFTSTYESYFVIIEDMSAATLADDLQLQVRFGSSTRTANYYGSSIYGGYNVAVSQNQTNNVSQFTIAVDTSDATYGGSGEILFSRVGNTAERPMFWGRYVDAYNINQYSFGGINGSAADTITGFLLKSSSSNITGAVTTYGLAKS